MRFLAIIALLFINTVVIAQGDSTSLKKAMQQLDEALLKKDSAALHKVLHKDLSFGHSNGWVQRRWDVWNDFKTGKLDYQKIVHNRVTILAIDKQSATVISNTNAEGLVNGNAFKLTLHVMQVWTKTKSGWQLLARQSAKL